MTLTGLKAEADRLSIEDRRKLVAHLVATLDQSDFAYRKRLTDLIDDADESHWATLDDLDARLGKPESD
jgi:hypothetical protein